MSSGPYFGSKTLLFLTGASQGIGKQIAIQFSRKLAAGSKVGITGRNIERLEQTKKEILEQCQTLTVQTFILELTEACDKDYEAIFRSLIGQNDTFEVAILVHNAPVYITETLQTHLIDLSKTELLSIEFHGNLINFITLNSVFLQNTVKVPQKLLIQLTDKLDTMGTFGGLSIYFTYTAARQMYFKCLLAEEGAKHNIKILNYTPGAVDTHTLKFVLDGCWDASLKELVNRDDVPIETSEVIVKRLCDVVAENAFENCSVVAFSEETQDMIAALHPA